MTGARDKPGLAVWSRMADIYTLAAPPRWAGPAVVAFGLASAFLEAFALLLFIPLLQSLYSEGRDLGRLGSILRMWFGELPSQHTTLLIIALFCFAVALKNGVSLLSTFVGRSVEGEAAHRLRTLLLCQTLHCGLDAGDGLVRSDIVTTIATNTWRISSGLTLIFGLAVSLCACVVFAVMMVLISVELTIVALVSVGLIAHIVTLATRKASRIGDEIVEENRAFGLRIWETLTSLRVVRAFNRESYEMRRLARNSAGIRRRFLALDMLWSLPGLVSELGVMLTIAGLILTAQHASIGVPALAAFLSLVYRMQAPLRDLMQAKVSLDGAAGAVADVAELLRATRMPVLKDGEIIAPAPREHIRFRDVSFRYGADRPWALRNVSIEIPIGKTTAIVGRSGAGKSTILALLFRFLDPTTGQIEADGVCLSRFRVASWRRHLGLMPQDVQLFNDTIEANIAYGDEHADAEAVRDAARIANADEFISAQPHGYRTRVGDHGAMLSGGQRQRLALARTVLRRPDVLMLDEATNSLDVESERLFQAALDIYANGRTVIVIAHRLSTVERADHVIVLESGGVVEAGTPTQLLDRDGEFARLHGLQGGRARESSE